MMIIGIQIIIFYTNIYVFSNRVFSNKYNNDDCYYNNYYHMTVVSKNQKYLVIVT
jgi:hypothetical protein